MSERPWKWYTVKTVGRRWLPPSGYVFSGKSLDEVRADQEVLRRSFSHLQQQIVVKPVRYVRLMKAVWEATVVLPRWRDRRAAGAAAD